MSVMGTPSLEHVARSAELVQRELERLLERAREADRVVADADGELEVFSPVRSRAARELRGIARMLTIAHCELVPPSDERFGASLEVGGWARDAERQDAAWRPFLRDDETEVVAA